MNTSPLKVFEMIITPELEYPLLCVGVRQGSVTFVTQVHTLHLAIVLMFCSICFMECRVYVRSSDV